MIDRAFIPTEEVDLAISEMESMLREAASYPSRMIALAALLGIRQELGLPIPNAPDTDRTLEHLESRGGALRRSPAGALRRRRDGELHD